MLEEFVTPRFLTKGTCLSQGLEFDSLSEWISEQLVLCFLTMAYLVWVDFLATNTLVGLHDAFAKLEPLGRGLYSVAMTQIKHSVESVKPLW